MVSTILWSRLERSFIAEMTYVVLCRSYLDGCLKQDSLPPSLYQFGNYKPHRGETFVE